jgi:hypothetical protein
VNVGQLAMHGESCIRGHRLKYGWLEGLCGMVVVVM